MEDKNSKFRFLFPDEAARDLMSRVLHSKKGESIVGCQPYEKTRIQQQFVLVTETVSGTVTETIRAQDSNKKLLHRERFEAEVLKHHGETHKGQTATYQSMVKAEHAKKFV